ncbi:unnamed protein product [Rangifer tarandus platyrhynchus]|uniref:Uncharacterized protein n=1 Tax=Rangifer tarandus platyrhynchus TaxID=3082113 RepID=A0ABN8YT23_RANTA|nr:unnamed protein product [Rangifer tarandus platyrhynchus]
MLKFLQPTNLQVVDPDKEGRLPTEEGSGSARKRRRRQAGESPPPSSQALAAAVLGRPPGLSAESEQVSAPDSRLAGPAELAKPPRQLRPATRGPGKLRERQLRGREDAPQHPRAAHGLRHLQPPGKEIHRGQGSGEKGSARRVRRARRTRGSPAKGLGCFRPSRRPPPGPRLPLCSGLEDPVPDSPARHDPGARNAAETSPAARTPAH